MVHHEEEGEGGVRRFMESLRLSGEGPVLKWMLFLITTFLILVTTGTSYGWAPVLIILQEDQVYHNLCQSNTDPVTGTVRSPYQPRLR